MSIMKYTRKYLLYSLLALVVICGVVVLVFNQIQKGGDEHGHDHADTFRPSDAQDKSAASRQSLWQKITPKLKKKPKSSHAHDHDDIVIPPAGPAKKFPRDLKERLNKVRIKHGGEYSREYVTNPDYYRDVYEAVSNGRDMGATIQLLKEYRIYTEFVLEHMDSYEAFKYVIEYAPSDLKALSTFTGNDIEYAKRTISEVPKSAEALEAGLYIARVLRETHTRRKRICVVLSDIILSQAWLYSIWGHCFTMKNRANRLFTSKRLRS